jgi:bifunctional DNase/RNase
MLPRAFIALVLAGASLTACGSSPPEVRSATVELPASSTVKAAPAPPAEAAEKTPERPLPPASYIEMEAVNVAPTPQGLAVVLGDKAGTVLLPIFVGGTEALSIELRMRQEKRERPLTHDLLDSVFRELRADLVKVHVDAVRDNVFFGRVFLSHNGRQVEIDARPSDAIALAVGAGVPIFVAASVLQEAGIYRDSGKEARTARP